MDRAALAALDMMTMARDRLAEARAQPPERRPGLLAVMVDCVDSGVVTDDQARDILLTLFNAGTETTSSLIATAIETLASDTDLQDRLRDAPEQIPDAVEQILNEDGPFQFHYRWTTTDTTLGGTAIPAESRVLLMWAAANRPSPGEEDASGPLSHFAFGRGLHFCIGAPLARLEARVVLEQLLAVTSAIALDPNQSQTRRPSIFLRRLDSLPIILEQP
jgi:cytochrome P450